MKRTPIIISTVVFMALGGISNAAIIHHGIGTRWDAINAGDYANLTNIAGESDGVSFTYDIILTGATPINSTRLGNGFGNLDAFGQNDQFSVEIAIDQGSVTGGTVVFDGFTGFAAGYASRSDGFIIDGVTYRTVGESAGDITINNEEYTPFTSNLFAGITGGTFAAQAKIGTNNGVALSGLAWEFDITPAPLQISSIAPLEGTLLVGTVSSPTETAPTYTVTGGTDQALFEVDPTTGVLSFLTAPDFENPSDADGDNVYMVQVTAQGDSTAVQNFLITVTNVPENLPFVFNAAVDDDLLNPANWLSNEITATPTPAAMAVDSTYIVAADATLDGVCHVNGDLTVNTGITLEVASSGTLTLNGGSDLAFTGTVSVSGAMVMSNTGTFSNPTTIKGGNLIINPTGTFTRSGLGESQISAPLITNHGSFIEYPNANPILPAWKNLNLTNSTTGIVILESKVYDKIALRINNAGSLTTNLAFGFGHRGTVINSGTIHAPAGLTFSTDATTTNNIGGIINIGGALSGLQNFGTVNLTGDSSFLQHYSAPMRNEVSGVINQGSHRLWVDYAAHIINAGVWNSSGEIRLDTESKITVASGGLLDNDGSWRFSTLLIIAL